VRPPEGPAASSASIWSRIAAGCCGLPKSLQDARATYPYADGVQTADGQTLTVFNISGNRYRLITRIRYDYQLVNIRVVLTHAEYDKETWKE